MNKLDADVMNSKQHECPRNCCQNQSLSNSLKSRQFNSEASVWADVSSFYSRITVVKPTLKSQSGDTCGAFIPISLYQYVGKIQAVTEPMPCSY